MRFQASDVFSVGMMTMTQKIIGRIQQTFAEALKRCGFCLHFEGWTVTGLPVHSILPMTERDKVI
jgi:hypothetical protein